MQSTFARMNYFLRRVVHPWHLRHIAAERLTEPLHMNAAAAFVALFGSFRAKVAFDLVLRRQFAFCILNAADQARKLGLNRLTLVELGVANGAGLLNMCSVAQRVTRETGIQFEVYGFDGGSGMPAPIDYRDHPELYQQGDFPIDIARLRAAMPAMAKLIIGDVAETVSPPRRLLLVLSHSIWTITHRPRLLWIYSRPRLKTIFR